VKGQKGASGILGKKSGSGEKLKAQLRHNKDMAQALGGRMKFLSRDKTWGGVEGGVECFG